MMYRLASPWTVELATLESAMEALQFVPCGATQDKSLGWASPRGEEHGALVEVVDGQWILKLVVETKVLPATVVRRHAEETIARIEAETGRKPGKKESREIREDSRLALLPQAFTKRASVLVWIEPKTRTLVLDCASQARADETMTFLVQAVPGLAVQLVNTKLSPALAMSQWLAAREAPAGFSIDRECELKAADESRSVVRYTRHVLDTPEVAQHIAQGKMPTRLALTWGDHVSFVLTETLQLKKVAVLDVVLEQAPTLGSDRDDDNFDADVSIATGELRRLLPDLIEVLGGEESLAGA